MPSAFLLLLALVGTVLAQSPQPQNPAQAGKRADLAGFDINALDRKADPCSDFYQFACGAWNASHPIPPDQALWGRFNELYERNQDILRDILEKYSANDPGRTPDQQKIGDFYASCMDEQKIEAQGLKPLQPELDRVAGMKTKAELAGEVARLHGLGVNSLFTFSSASDAKNASQVIAEADQGGLGLPDRDYYLKHNEKSEQTREHYVQHVARMLELAGEDASKAAADAKIVMDLETSLARVSMTRVERRNPDLTYHKMARQELAAFAPGFSWDTYLKDIAAPPVESLNVTAPEFYQGVGALLGSIPLESWKTYLRWHLLHSAAGLLPASVVEEDFAFFGKTLTGQEKLRARWKRCVAMTDRGIGEALGRFYVDQTFGPQGKVRTLGMVRALENALERDIRSLPWMTQATRSQALLKLHNIANKIGYPERWRDYGKLQIARGDALGNGFRANEFEFHRVLNKIGKPLDRTEWRMTPPTVNAYYSPPMNDIDFPAGILQPPFFDTGADDPVNYGAIGAVIGHELTHGFDDRGSKYDAHGNLHEWWTAEDRKEFEKRTSCLADEYSAFTAIDDLHLNGRLTLGENTADNGGVRIADMALHSALGGRSGQNIDGFTPEQRFFLSYAQIWCQNVRPEAARLRALTDPHSPGRWRVNGVLVNTPEFRGAFNCKVGAKMAPQNACRVW
jgi:putative endopeptidase